MSSPAEHPNTDKKISKQKASWRARLLAISSLLFGIFFVFSYFVHKGAFKQLDFDTTVRLHDNIPTRIDPFFSSFSIIGSFEITTTIFFLSLLAFSFYTRRWHRVFLFSFFVLFHIVEILGKTLIEQSGPPFMFHRYAFDFHFPSSYVSTDYFSFPSGHVGRTLFMSAFYSILIVKSNWGAWKKWISISGFTGLSVIMIVSRILLGEHWFTDTVGGTLLGLAMATLAMVFW